ncbi:MAG TPA: hypothetical protein VLH84_02000 [Patescibacteria group bacterium]|nr:hypothetical protein [Patescibacteria group bacterium]
MSAANLCPTGNTCALTVENGPACGFAANHLPPLPLAEDLCPAALHGQIAFEATNPDEYHEERRLVRRAWANVEYALALPPGSEQAADHFDDAHLLLGRTFAFPGAHHDALFDAGLLDAHLDHFRASQADEPFDESQEDLLGEDLALLVDQIDELSAHPDEQRGYRVKLGVNLLLLRAGLDYYPGSMRESRTRDPGFATQAHDGCVILGGRKVPIKSRGNSLRASEYDTSAVLFIPYGRTVRRAHGEALGRRVADDDFAGMSVRLLADEARGESLAEEDARWMDRLTDIVSQQVVDFRATLG